MIVLSKDDRSSQITASVRSFNSEPSPAKTKLLSIKHASNLLSVAVFWLKSLWIATSLSGKMLPERLTHILSRFVRLILSFSSSKIYRL